ncbi:MAG: hypothetical protein ACK56F_19920, partial [bacterium]
MIHRIIVIAMKPIYGDSSVQSSYLSSSPHEGKFNPLSRDLANKWNESQGSFSQLSVCVNDSARGLHFDEVYTKQELLGEGGFAVVFRCQHWETHK